MPTSDRLRYFKSSEPRIEAERLICDEGAFASQDILDATTRILVDGNWNRDEHRTEAALALSSEQRRIFEQWQGRQWGRLCEGIEAAFMIGYHVGRLLRIDPSNVAPPSDEEEQAIRRLEDGDDE